MNCLKPHPWHIAKMAPCWAFALAVVIAWPVFGALADETPKAQMIGVLFAGFVVIMGLHESARLDHGRDATISPFNRSFSRAAASPRLSCGACLTIPAVPGTPLIR